MPEATWRVLESLSWEVTRKESEEARIKETICQSEIVTIVTICFLAELAVQQLRGTGEAIFVQ